jgi:hypothetical protein
MKLNDFVSLFSHLAVAVVATIGHKVVENVPLWAQITVLVLSVTLLVLLLNRIKERLQKSDIEKVRDELTTEKETLRSQLSEELSKTKEELDKQDRYNHLRRAMLDVIGEFVRERYRANYSLTSHLSRLIEASTITVENVKAALTQADEVRREKVKLALGRASQILKEDIFKKPKDADGENKDKMGVSFYAVVQSGDGKDVLEKRYRAFPNEGEPKTQNFSINEGAAGKCWAERVPVICENGGDDPEFKEMRTGQKAEYASMACFPAIADFPKEKVSEVFGVLTIHSTERKGYFEKRLDQFWFDIFQPLCDALVYSAKSSELIETIGNSFELGINSREDTAI